MFATPFTFWLTAFVNVVNCDRLPYDDLVLRGESHPTMTPGKEFEQQADIALLARIASGDESAFTELYGRFSPALFGMALRMMNDAKEAEDVLQESFVYIWRKASGFDAARSSPFAWAVMIVRHKAIDKLRIRRRFEKVSGEALDECGDSRVEESTPAFDPVLNDRRQQLQAALQRIPGEQREAVELAFFRGLTHDEIAHQLQTPIGTIKARIRRGLIRLRDYIKEGL
ncbi:MAG TPA: sigma-70 family RNA polymerase sigma factor [Chthoniobacterales bacterium]